MVGCQTLSENVAPDPFDDIPPSVASLNDPMIGDQVVVVGSDLDVYDRVGGSVAGTQSVGATGTVDRGPRTRDGITWYEVDFDTGIDGFVDADGIEVDDGDPPANEPPVASFTYSDNELTVDFTDTSSDDGVLAAWYWTFGDGGSSSAQNPQHTYAAAGTYDVTLEVTDDEGETGSTTTSITISDEPPPTGGIVILGGAGCSMARDAFHGYWLYGTGGHTVWPKEDQGYEITKKWSGGGLNIWGEQGGGAYNTKWTSFQSGLSWNAAGNGGEPTALLFMPCVGKLPQHDVITEAYRDMLRHVAEEFAARAGADVPRYIVGTPRYADGYSGCDSPPEFSNLLALEGELLTITVDGQIQTAFTYVGSDLPSGTDKIDIIYHKDDLKDACHVGSTAGYQHAAQELAEWMDSL